MADAMRAWLRGDETTEARAGGVIVVDFIKVTTDLLRAIVKGLGGR